MSVNKVILVGNLGKDPEVRVTSANVKMATFSVATHEYFTDKSGERQKRTEWHSLVAWGRLAEICESYLHIGEKVYIEGKLKTRSYTDKNDEKRYVTEIVVVEMNMLGHAPKKDTRFGENNSHQKEQSERNKPDLGFDPETIPF